MQSYLETVSLQKSVYIIDMIFIMDIIRFVERVAEVAELVDALDSGSSGHYARRGSTPLFGTISFFWGGSYVFKRNISFHVGIGYRRSSR